MIQAQAIVLSTVLLLCLTVLSMCQYEVINTGRFGIIENTIELECRNNGVALQRAFFWLNRVSRNNELLALGVDVTVRPSGRIVFQITRELEGTFFCGQNLENFGRVGQQLIAYPDRFIPPNNERTFFAKVGTTARLRCSILPGALRAQYFADWRNATSSIEVARLDGPRPSPPLSTTPDPRFMVDETTFSLIIESVSLSDAGRYQCVLGVRDPAGLRLIYPQTETLDLTLIVYQAPIITQSPENRIIALDDNRPNQSATFHCQARGQPKPEIEWLHNSQEIENDLNSDMTGKYVVRTDAASTPTGDYIVSSWLTVNTVDAFDAGKVVCSVMADDDELPTDLQRVQTTAQLAVIGSFSSLDLLISTNGDIIFKLRLPSPILVPVQLSIIYIDANDNRRISPRVTENAYNGTDLITHLEPSFQVPTDFNTVRIRIALRYQRLQGPFNESALTFDLRRPNFFTEEEASVWSVAIISIAGSVIAICVVIAVLVTLLTCIACRHTMKRKHTSHMAYIARMEAGHSQILAEKHSDNQAELNILRENHEQIIKKLDENNEAKLNTLKEENDAEIERRTLEYERNQESTNQKYKHELMLLEAKHEHETRLKLLDMYSDKMSACNGGGFKITYIVGKTEISIEKKNTSCGDMIDGPHTMYTAQAVDKRPMLLRGESIDYGSNFQLEQECVIDCFKNIVEASMKDSRIGPTLRRLVSTDQLER